MGALQNPANDARIVAETLEAAGFKVVVETDLNQRRMKEAIRDFGDRLTASGDDSIGLFYYAGHGMQIGGTNYLIPVGAGAKIRREPDVDIEAVDAAAVLSVMEYAGNRLNIVILDACRNNPFHRGFRSISHGLARMDAPMGSIIAYATAPGSVADDGTGEYGTYTQELVRAMRTPGRPIEDVFKRTRMSVIDLTDGRQVPWESSSLVGEFHFFAPDEFGEPGDADARATAAWVGIADTADPKKLNAFIDQYPDSPLARLARKRLASIAYPPDRETPSDNGHSHATQNPSRLTTSEPQPSTAAPAPRPPGTLTRSQLQAELNRQLQSGMSGGRPAAPPARSVTSAPTLVDPNTGTVLSDKQAAAVVAACEKLSRILQSSSTAGQARSAAQAAIVNQLRTKCESYGLVTY